MSTQSFSSSQSKELRKRRLKPSLALHLHSFLFFLVISSLSVRILNESQITLNIYGNSDPRLIDGSFKEKISNVRCVETETDLGQTDT